MVHFLLGISEVVNVTTNLVNKVNKEIRNRVSILVTKKENIEIEETNKNYNTNDKVADSNIDHVHFAKPYDH